ncbi:MAG: LOG family protein [Parachlamydiaceae bacterium]|nr:LOG family protein [Parachlamydiaceae bacterium]
MRKDVYDPQIIDTIQQLVSECDNDASDFAKELITQMIQNSLKLLQGNHDIGQLKLISRSMKEMRYAYQVFNHYKNKRCISIFGSARTPEIHPDYIAAKNFSAGMSSHGWMCITGAANGIMKAGLEGSKQESSFGLSIRLPFEVPTNSVIAGDAKLISFRYFFTRKLMFTSHSDAFAAFPGGFGTLDELFEMLTLQQTGRALIVPIVLVEGKEGTYWKHWEEYLDQQLMKNGWTSPADKNLYYIAKTPEEAVEHIRKFYHCYHSSRYVKDILVLRLNKTLSQRELGAINLKYKSLVASGEIAMSPPLPEETDHLDLPRLTFHHTHSDFGLIRALINDINDFSP